MVDPRTILGITLFCVPVLANWQPQWDEIELREKLDRAERAYDTLKQQHHLLKGRFESMTKERALLPSTNQFRLSTQTANPVTVANRNNQATLYLVPYTGNEISLYYRGNWRLFITGEISINLGALPADSLYDVFAFRDTSGAVSLELSAAWSSESTRSDALAMQDGVYVKGSDSSRRYLGTILTDDVGGRLDDGVAARGLWNYYNRVPRLVRRYDGTNQWNYGTATYRVAGNDDLNEVSFVIGVNEVLVRSSAKTNNMSPQAASRAFGVGIGINSQTVNSALLMGTHGNGNATTEIQVWADYYGYPGIGRLRFSWIEMGSGANVRSWGDHNQPDPVRSGIVASYEG